QPAASMIFVKNSNQLPKPSSPQSRPVRSSPPRSSDSVLNNGRKVAAAAPTTKDTNLLNDEPARKGSLKNNVERAFSLEQRRQSDDAATPFTVTFRLNLVSVALFLAALAFRLYELDQPSSIVFDELHYGRFVSLYLRRTFF